MMYCMLEPRAIPYVPYADISWPFACEHSCSCSHLGPASDAAFSLQNHGLCCTHIARGFSQPLGRIRSARCSVRWMQVLKNKTGMAEDGRGRFKTQANGPLRIADREKKVALRT